MSGPFQCWYFSVQNKARQPVRLALQGIVLSFEHNLKGKGRKRHSQNHSKMNRKITSVLFPINCLAAYKPNNPSFSKLRAFSFCEVSTSNEMLLLLPP